MREGDKGPSREPPRRGHALSWLAHLLAEAARERSIMLPRGFSTLHRARRLRSCRPGDPSTHRSPGFELVEVGVVRNRLTDVLGIEVPIVLAPMVPMADARLAVAVSEAGGLGTFGAWSGMGIDEPYVRRQ